MRLRRRGNHLWGRCRSNCLRRRGDQVRRRGMTHGRNLAFALYCVACLGALTWPGYDWLGNRIEPLVLGLPFSLAWNVGWVLLTFLVLVGYHATRPGTDDV